MLSKKKQTKKQLKNCGKKVSGDVMSIGHGEEDSEDEIIDIVLNVG